MVIANITHRSDGVGARVTALEALLWEDLRFPANAINLPGAAANPAVDLTTYYGALQFAGNQDNDIGLLVQMPHGWANGTAVIPHLHLVNTAGGTAATVWELRVKKADVNDVFEANYVLHQTLSFVPNASATMHQLAAFNPIDMTGLGDSAMLSIWIRRRSDDASSQIMTMLEFDIHYQSAARGSINEIGER